MSELQEIEISIENAKEKIKLAEALTTLTKLPEWKTVIDDGYFVKEASNTVLLRANPQFSDAEYQDKLLKQIDAIGTFRQYLGSIYQVADMARKSIEDYEKTRTEVLEEAGE